MRRNWTVCSRVGVSRAVCSLAFFPMFVTKSRVKSENWTYSEVIGMKAAVLSNGRWSMYSEASVVTEFTTLRPSTQVLGVIIEKRDETWYTPWRLHARHKTLSFVEIFQYANSWVYIARSDSTRRCCIQYRRCKLDIRPTRRNLQPRGKSVNIQHSWSLCKIFASTCKYNVIQHRWMAQFIATCGMPLILMNDCIW